MAVPHTWPRAFRKFLTPYLDTLHHAKQRACLPKYLRGLLAGLERKSIEPIAEYVGLPYQRLHHFIHASPWKADELERVLVQQAQTLCGGKHSVLIIDDTALPKTGVHSVGVTHQYCGALGKLANCQSLVTLTLAGDRVFAPLAMRLFLPKTWTDDPERCTAAGVPVERLTPSSKGALALDELDRVLALGVTFRVVLADAGYGINKAFRQALTARGLTWAVGVVGHQKVFRQEVVIVPPGVSALGHPCKNPRPSDEARPVHDVLNALPPHAWRAVRGQGKACWVVIRARIADGAVYHYGRHLPGEEVWVVGEKRRSGEVKYYITNHNERTSKAQLVRDIRARWACETCHQQLKEELGLDHFEGRSWQGLEHHLALVLLTMLFLQSLRTTDLQHRTLPGVRRWVSVVLDVVRDGRCPHCSGVVSRTPCRSPCRSPDGRTSEVLGTSRSSQGLMGTR
ncbi:IS701 family transposase [Deinococcus pimensis]|uniref:IS701 family transposase n=1 Tax=Deinococcus pimensis TaxID=309888 RepID=UPI0004B1D54D